MRFHCIMYEEQVAWEGVSNFLLPYTYGEEAYFLYKYYGSSFNL